jgi:large subunit ribosomal protein L31
MRGLSAAGPYAPAAKGHAMKADIHPKYDNVQVQCACGNTFTTRATVPNIKVDICSACHPFYTGKQKFVDAAGRVERFQKKFGGQYFAKGKEAKAEK